MDLAAVMLVDPGANSAHEQLLSDLMISVIDRFTPWRTLSRSLQEIENNRDRFDWRIRRAVNLLRQEPHIVRDIRRLAREFGLSRAHFYRLFERSTRMTPHVYLNLLRMELAVKSVVHTSTACRPSATPWLYKSRSFHSLFPRPCRRQSQRIPQRRYA